ncbi:integrase catalytic domain-containing protein [Trichonephila clavata]|uniref:Integrase catalytic domain-containing protein n=1 Tax=Trichonephila clavata TaxID=2740835 RepID=A0A8X6H8B9_TRICU|nr:integrase catalytic domain-containing protein [Trichonephila clavata]
MNLIGNNPSLNEVQKLCYLKGALKNKVSLIQSDQDTFDSLIKALEVRYENTRALVYIHIADILSINKLNSENPSQIRSIVDKRPQKDTLTFSVSSIADVSDSCTIKKRSVLSATSMIFDPLGLNSPVVRKAKLVMQELWGLKLDWNDSLPIHSGSDL